MFYHLLLCLSNVRNSWGRAKLNPDSRTQIFRVRVELIFNFSYIIFPSYTYWLFSIPFLKLPVDVLSFCFRLKDLLICGMSDFYLHFLKFISDVNIVDQDGKG